MLQGNLFCSTFLSRNVVLRSCCAAVALLGMQAQSFAAASHGTGGKAKANVAAGKALPSVQPAGEVRKARQASAPMIARANEDIAVQGTRLANSVLSPSTREHSTVQVFRYGADQLRETGQTNILAAIAQLSPAVTSSPFGGIGGNGLNKTMQLRNLGADQTLMLVNGKRRHVDANFNYFQSGPNYGTDPADLSLIPISAIDHVEIITEGATALYGQDAEAGAVNIVLKRDTKGGSINLQNSGYYLGDGQAFDGNANYGLALGHDGGYFNVAAQISNQLSTNRSGDYPGNLYFSGDPRNKTASKDVQRIAGTPRTLLETVSTNAAYPVGAGFEVYNTSTFAHKDMVQAQTYRAPSNDTVVRALYPDGMQPLALAEEYDFQVDNGIRAHNFLGMQWDAYVNYGRDSMKTLIANTDNPTLGVESPRTFKTSLFISTELAAGLRATKFFHPSALPKPLSLSYGFEYRFDTYQVGAGDLGSVIDGGMPILDGPNAGKPAAAGAVDKFGVPAMAGSINNRGIYDGYVNMDLYLTKRWEWTFGGHVAGYDDVGIHPTGSIGTRYDINSRLAVRANANTGYRAPTLGEEAFFAETTYPTYRTAQLPVNSTWAKSLGASRLKGEQSRSFSVGVDATLLPDWTLTANLYRISINDRLFNTSQFGGNEIENLLAGAGLPGVYYASYYSNPVNTTTSGGDIATSYTWRTARAGTFQFRFSVNIGDTQISHYNATPALLSGMGLSTFNRTNEEYLLHSSPRNVENLTVLWNKGPYSIRVEEQRFGAYTWVASPSLQQTQWTYAGPSYITNLEIGYDIFKRWHVAAGAYNVGNHYPARANAASRAALQNSFLYAGNSPYGFNGGMYYVKTSLRF